MKKILLIAAMALIGVTSINAQYKPGKMTLTAELNYSPTIAVSGQKMEISLLTEVSNYRNTELNSACS